MEGSNQENSIKYSSPELYTPHSANLEANLVIEKILWGVNEM